MPRSPTTYSLPPGTTPQVPNTVISSSMFTSAMDDIAQTFNTAQPIAYGGTGATNVPDALTNLGIPADVSEMATVVETLRNRVVNGDKTVSQENGQTSGTTNGRYISDQNAMYFVSSAGTFTGVNVLTLSPAGGYRDQITITVADASLAAGEYLLYTQNLEGSNVRDLKWGTADAVDAVARFGFRGPAGTYAYRLGNSAGNRSFVALFTISAPEANTDTVQTISIPGDTTGTWLNTDGVIGITRDIVLACGSTFQGTTGWQAGLIYGTSGVSNGMGTGAAVFQFFDEGFKADPDATGVYGVYEANVTDAVYWSERYAEKTYDINVAPGAITENGAQIGKLHASDRVTIRFRTPKCKAATGTWYSSGTGTAGKARDIGTSTDIDCSTAYASSNSITAVTTSTDGNLVAVHVMALARLSA